MAKKDKLPKTVLGIAVPKQLRRLGAAKAFLASPLGRQVVADVLIAAAGAAAAALTRAGPSAAQVAVAGGRAASAAGGGAQSAGTAVGSVLSEVARTILPGVEAKQKTPKPNKKKLAKAERKGKAPASVSRH